MATINFSYAFDNIYISHWKPPSSFLKGFGRTAGPDGARICTAVCSTPKATIYHSEYLVAFVMKYFRVLRKKTAWKTHQYIFFSWGHSFGKLLFPQLELRLRRWTLQCFPQPKRCANICVLHIYVQFTRWSGWNRLFSSWDVLIFNAPFFLFPTDGQCHEAWSSMCPIHFSPGFSSRHIVIRCRVSVLIAVGTHITWFWHVHATEVPHIVIATNLTTHILQYARFDLTGSLFALLCSDWPTSWCGMVWYGWNLMTGYQTWRHSPMVSGCFRQRCPTRLSVSSVRMCKLARICI